MCCWQVNSSHTSVHSHPSWEENCGKTFGYLTSLTKEFPIPKELNPWKSLQLNPSKLDGKTKGYQLIACHSKMHLLFLHALDGHCWLILSCRVQLGFVVLKVITSPPSTSTRNIGWGNLQRIFQMVVQSYLKASKKKLKPHLILFYQELSLKKQEATLCSWVVMWLTMIWNSNFSWWQSLPILTSDLKSQPSVPSLTSSSLKEV